MRTLDAYRRLRDYGEPVIETTNAAVVLGISTEAASRHLRHLADRGMAVALRKGLWLLDPQTTKAAMAPYLTAPYPAYVSLWSALAHHDMIEQIPARTEVASLSRTRTITTPVGAFTVHRLAPELFGGYTGDPAEGYLATPEKALFDVVYTNAPRSGRVGLPELTIPDSFEMDSLWGWVARIARARLRTIVGNELRRAIGQAARHGAA